MYHSRILWTWLLLAATSWMPARAQLLEVEGQVASPVGLPLEHVEVQISHSECGAAPALVATTDATGHFTLHVSPGIAQVVARADHYAPFRLTLDLEGDRSLRIVLQPEESVTVYAQPDVLAPDPATAAYTDDDLLPANAGRPGVPYSVPGLPVESASGGIKAPQYFAPGVAGDHGAPVAQYFQIGGFLFPNNLTANAHGNGYADPNIVIADAISGVQVDNGAFDARHGDHSINLAVNYVVRDRLTPFLALSSDGRDGAIAAGWSPARPQTQAWIAAEASFGNGFLARPEQRQQYKLSGLRDWTLGHHQLTLFGLGYYGFSRIPGLIPLRTPVTGDTINPRQKDLTHTTLAVLADSWQLSPGSLLTLAGFFRSYSLALDSDFGDGLIEQGEFRTIEGGNATFTRTLTSRLDLLAGLDYRRDAPRNLDLAHADAQGVLRLVTSNDLTITNYGPFAALQASLGHTLRLYAGLRHDRIQFANTDKQNPPHSYTQTPGTTNPKATVSVGKLESGPLPLLSFSFGKAFHANDPRIGAVSASGTTQSGLISQSREYQLTAAKVLAGTELRLVLAHQTNSEELARIDPDTGLQQDTGPSINRYFTLQACRRYGLGFVQASWSQADARDRILGLPVPEAPRLIIDATGTMDRLPLRISGKAEYEYVGEKPLGDNFRARPVQEIRLALSRSFADGRWIVAADGLLASGASGQSVATFALPGEAAPFERVVGVPLRSYASLALRYQFR